MCENQSDFGFKARNHIVPAPKETFTVILYRRIVVSDIVPWNTYSLTIKKKKDLVVINMQYEIYLRLDKQ